MKVLEINKFHYSRRGADKHFIDVINLLQQKGNEVAVFSMDHPKNIGSNWSRYFLSYVGYNQNDSTLWQKFKGGVRMFFSLEAKRKINKILDDFQPDIVHIHNIYHQLSPMILFEIKKRNIPIVMTVHDFKIINPNHALYHNGKNYERCKNGKFYQCVIDKCVKNSYPKSFVAMLEAYWHEILGTYRKNIDIYVIPSEFVRNALIEWGIDENKIKVLPHFSEKNINASDNNESNNVKYALYSGSLKSNKNVQDLMDIFESLNGFKLYLAGINEDNFDLGNYKNVKYLGHLKQTELKKYIIGSQFVISASRLPETFGLVALEANVLGKPFIGYKTGAFPEIIKNGENGFLASNKSELEKCVKKVFNNEIKFDEGSTMRETVAKYSSDSYHQQLMRIFSEAIDKNKKK